MPPPAVAEPAGRVPPRDWLILPLLAAATLLLFAAALDGIARRLYAESGSTMPCLVVTDPATGVRGVPNSACDNKNPEAANVRYAFNRDGFRTPQPDAAKPAGVFRVVTLGSSLVEGMRVAQADSFAGLLPALLAARAGRPVDVYNEGLQWGTPAGITRRLDAVFAARPDALLWMLTPWDINNVGLVVPYVPGVQDVLIEGQPPAPPAPPPARTLAERWRRALARNGSPWGVAALAWSRLIAPLGDTSAVLMLQHLLYLSPSQYARHVALQGDAAGYLRVPMPPSWIDRLAAFRRYYRRVAGRARAAGVPVVATLVPARAQAVMTGRNLPPGIDPAALDRALAAIVRAEGGRWISIVAPVQRVPDAGDLYLPVDDHLTRRGNRVVAEATADAMMQAPPPGLVRGRGS